MDEFCKVTLNLSRGSAYEFRVDSKIPTAIEFRRKYSGKSQKCKIEGDFENHELHNIVFLIKRGCPLTEINNLVKSYTI
jgi:hypothetical protein